MLVVELEVLVGPARERVLLDLLPGRVLGQLALHLLVDLLLCALVVLGLLLLVEVVHVLLILLRHVRPVDYVVAAIGHSRTAAAVADYRLLLRARHITVRIEVAAAAAAAGVATSVRVVRRHLLFYVAADLPRCSTKAPAVLVTCSSVCASFLLSFFRFLSLCFALE